MNLSHTHTKLIRKVVAAAIALVVIASGLTLLRPAAASNLGMKSSPTFAAVAQSEQPQVGPGIAQVGSNAQKSAISNTKAGSILFFHKYTSDNGNPSGVNTLYTVTNTNPRDAVSVRLFYVRDCTVTSQYANLGPNQARTFLASAEDPGKTGYIVVVALNSQGIPTQFNWLIGAASLHDAQGHEASYNAVGVAKRTGGPVLSVTGSVAELKFDDVEYDRLPQTIALDNIQSQDVNTASASRTDLTVYSPLADLSSASGSAAKVTAIAYDQSGRSFPAVVDTTCGLRAPATAVWTNPALNTFITPGKPGWASFAAATVDNVPLPLLGLSLTDGTSAAQRNARNMQVLTRLSSFSIKVPVSTPPNPVSDAPTANQPDALGGSLGAGELKSGSILIYPRFTTGTFGDSRLNLTNTHPTQKVRVRIHFSGLADPTTGKDLTVNILPNQSISIDPAATVTNQKGWAIAIAIDSRSVPFNFNYLIGSGQVRDQANGSFGYNALAVAKNSPGALTRNEDQLTADIPFNDLQYDRLASTQGIAALSSQSDNTTTVGYARPPASLLDAVNVRGSIQATVYDDLLAAFTATIAPIEVKIGTVRPNPAALPITSTIALGHKGWLKLSPASPTFPWTSNTPGSAFVGAGTAWSGGFNGGLTPYILTVFDNYQLKVLAANPDNQPPTANFEPIDVYTEARSLLGTIVRLDGRSSTDPNVDDPLSYQWFDNDTLISVAPVSDFRLGKGTHIIKLIVTDSNDAASEPKTTLVEVRDTLAPIMSGVPSAITKTTGSSAGFALNFSLPIAYDMVDGFLAVTASKAPGSVFPIGKTVVTFTAVDFSGNQTTASMEVNVIKGVANLPTLGGVPDNKTPYMNNINDQYVLAGKVRSYLIQAQDPDGNPITFSLQNAPSFARLDAIDPVAGRATLLITPQQGDAVVTNNVRVVLNDGQNRNSTFATLPFRIIISDVANDETGSGQGPGPVDPGPGPGPGPGGNRAPLAKAAPLPASVQATSKLGGSVHLDGSQSTDPDGDALTYSWKDNDTVIATTAVADVSLPAGQHSITLTVSDGRGGTNTSAAQAVEVLPRPLTVISVTPARIPVFNQTTMVITGTGFNSGTKVSFACTSFCQGGSQITVTISKIEEDTIILSAKSTQSTPLGNRDVVVTNPNGTSVKLPRSNFVAQ
jgi:hypothetical protein